MREIYKNLELPVEGENQSFRIQKMNAFDGAYLMKIVTEKVLPLLSGLTQADRDSLSDERLKKLLGDMLPGVLSSMDKNEMRQLMVTCLQTVSVLLPAGYQEAVDANGNFGVSSLEYDTAVCLRLTYEVIVFNCSGFFAESGLASLLGQLAG